MADLYDGPIIDAHHHFWDTLRNHHPWLSGEENIPFRYGDYSAIKRPYYPDDYLADAGEHRVVATVYVETEWDPRDPIGETCFIHEVAARYGAPNAVVAQAWLDAPDASALLAAQARFERVRSVRHKPGGPASPDEVGRSRTLMSDDAWRCGYAELARHGLHFDLQTPWWNLPEAIALARDFPGIQLILNHAGLPSDRSEQGLAGWHAAMAKLAECANVAVKVSGIGLPGRRWCVEDNAWIVGETIAMFGAERVMFASNFPVDSLCGSFDDIYGGFKRIVADLPRHQQQLLFHDNARRLYRTLPDVIRIPDASSDLRTTA
ncbi:thioesterase [Pseudomonas sp. PA1(2017)]|uniref:amidohydrolase family protein n=1 Tax=Pseudomonas sp. PA1(2017) TaxID=1932113 RepID=UPI000966DF6C|nr:amidohydrolase [Pseudomonas sp. PA1(2017)]OLU14712.1 thioesterase [Pseudomonas sp. PA1(2017)]